MIHHRSWHLDAGQKLRSYVRRFFARVLIQFFAESWRDIFWRESGIVEMIHLRPREREREYCHGNDDPSALPIHTSLSLFSILAHFPATLSRFHSLHPPSLSFSPRPPARKLKCSVRYLRVLRLGIVNAKARSFTNNAIIVAQKYDAGMPDYYYYSACRSNFISCGWYPQKHPRCLALVYLDPLLKLSNEKWRNYYRESKYRKITKGL